jgi:23S rRNA (uracil1939-C5)-methyltransferase
MNFRLVREVARLVELVEPTNVLELFAGMGNLTGGIAQHAEHVDAFEVDPEAVSTGRSVLNAMGLMNVRLKRADLNETPIPKGEVADHDLVVIDPPRSGARAVCEALATRPTKHLIYVACDAACLGRDAKTLLENGFSWESVTMLDMFPRTAHIETVAYFTR